MKHNHRITPGHMGGQYVEGNVISVEVTSCDKQTANHIMWHFANWQLYGKEEDNIAWRALAGFLNQEEIIRESLRAGGIYAGKLPYWTNRFEEIRSHECPGEGWIRGRSDAVKEKIKQYRTGKKDSETARQNKSKAAKDKPKSKSHKENMKKSAKRGKDHPNFGKTGSLSPTYGTKRTEEQLLKMSGPNNPQYGKPNSEEQKEKIRAKMKRKKHWVNSENEHKFQEESPGEGWVNGRKWTEG
jgi:hypothetical protein